MKLDDVIKKWDYNERDVHASIEMWNSIAEEFNNFDNPTTENSLLLKIIANKNLINSKSHVLDVGCGVGKYSYALAEKCAHVTGLDLSPKMIDLAKKNKSNLKNVDFFVNDWHASNLESLGYNDKFDLVVANMTPAVRNAETFLKINEASKGYCILTKPIKRKDPVSDEIRNILKINDKKESADLEVLYSLEILWLKGLLPSLNYEEQVWDMNKTVNSAYQFYANRMKSYRNLTQDDEKNI